MWEGNIGMYINNTSYPSYSDIVRPYIDIRWYDDECRERGTIIHEAIADYLQGLKNFPLPEDWQPYFDSFLKWAPIIDKVVLLEERLINEKLGYCGQLDLIAILKGDNEPTVIDFKTSQAAQKPWRLQASAYRNLAEVDRGIQIHRSISVRLKKNGSGCLINEYNSYKKDFNIFLSCLNAYKFFNNK